jgi:hypothetical protein
MRNWFDNMMKRESKSSAGALKLKPPRGISSGRKACATEGAISAFKNNTVDQLLKDEDHKGIRLSDVGNWDEWHCDRMAMLLRGSVTGRDWRHVLPGHRWRKCTGHLQHAAAARPAAPIRPLCR